MKLNKIIAAVLALAQLVFGAVLITRGTALDRKAEAHLKEIVANGTVCRFELDSFYYYPDSVIPIDFSLKQAEDPNWDRYITIQTDEAGLSTLGPSYEMPSEGLWLDRDIGYHYLMDDAALKEAFAGVDENDRWFMPTLFGRGKFNIGGNIVPVYAIASVYQGEIVFTGIQIGDTVY